ncbi:unnamed protein product [Nesidiocoris tenuis]|uniref:Uncharacterized protein n=1 Tax=Nesidiocoris tenuis TaxID=355587 RepID=A0A6H5GBB1_9HEMI|nr:unnamed protein product [Nesidiocoris tenuis]
MQKSFQIWKNTPKIPYSCFWVLLTRGVGALEASRAGWQGGAAGGHGDAAGGQGDEAGGQGDAAGGQGEGVRTRPYACFFLNLSKASVVFP